MIVYIYNGPAIADIGNGAMIASAVPLAYTLDRFPAEQQVTYDSVSLLFMPGGTVETQTTFDTFWLQTTKNLDEPVAMVDVLIAVTSYVRQYDETVNLMEGFGPLQTTKVFAETVTTDDAAAINGNANPSDTQVAVDATSLNMSKTFADAGTQSDGGLLWRQDYMATGDYFAADYLGTSLTF